MNEIATIEDHAEVLCGDALYRCRCVKPYGHVDAGDALHACGADVCGGTWEWLDDVRFVPHSYPRGEYRGAVVPPQPDVRARDCRPFVECHPDGTDASPGLLRIQRGGIRYIQPLRDGRT